VAPVAKIKRGGTLKAIADKDWDTIDPVNSIVDSMVYGLVYDHLTDFRRNPTTKNFEVVPELAESWEITDPKTVVLRLRKGVKFHDGTAFNAEAAKYNVERVLKSKRKQLMPNVESATVVDEFTVKLNLSAPSGSLLTLISRQGTNQPGMVSPTAEQKYGKDYGFAADKIAGSGPMKITEWLKNDRLTLKRTGEYWAKGVDGQPLTYYDEAVFRFIPDKSVATVEVRAGNVDLVERVLGKDVPAIKANPNLVYYPKDFIGTYLSIGFNPKNGPFAQNLKLRQAALHAIDREAMAKTVGLGEGKAWYYWWVPGGLGYDDTLPKYEYNLEKARQLVKDAGHPTGVDIVLLQVSRVEDNQMSQMLQQMWGAAGIRTRIDAAERLAVFAQTATNEGYDANPFRVGGAYTDPDSLSVQFQTDGASNWVRYSNPEVDKCFQEARSYYDTVKRAETYKQCQRLVHNDAIYGNMWFWYRNDVTSKRVNGWTETFLVWPLNDIWLD
jgi:peptide/nickel transport system substrate-binding protein